MSSTEIPTIPGYAKRYESWDEISAVATIGRQTMAPIPGYRLLKAATQIEASAAARLLLVHLIGYLGPDKPDNPEARFVVFPGNTRLADELRCSSRSIQRQADELEAKGMIRRCYNGLNRRIGFDLTPFAVQHEAVIGGIVAIQTKRKQDRELAQLELSLQKDRIARPVLATLTSSQGDTHVAHNSSKQINKDGNPAAENALTFLDTLDLRVLAGQSSHTFGSEDRTVDFYEEMLLSITRRFTGGGRASHLGWASALKQLGQQRAVALFLVAENDPRRRTSPERYFGWLLKISANPDMHDAIIQAARRAASVHQSPPPAQPLPPAEDEPQPAPTTKTIGNLIEPFAQPDENIPPASAAPVIVTAIRSRVGEQLYRTWLNNASIELIEDEIVVEAKSGFAASWIDANLAGAIAEASAALSSRPITVKVRAAA